MNKWDNVDIVRDAIKLDWQQFSSKYPQFCSYDAWRRKRYDAEKERLPLVQMDQIQKVPAIIPDFEPEMRLPLMDIMYLADLHVPYHDPLWVQRSIKVANVFRIGELMIGGDLFNFEKLSRFGQNGPGSKLEEDLAKGGAVLDAYLQWFEHIYIFQGNHDTHFGRKLDTNYKFERLIRSCLPYGIPLDSAGNPRIIISDREYAFMGPEGDRDSWMFSHPRKHDGLGGKVPVLLADRNQVNVLGAHNHRFGCLHSNNGKWLGIDPGCMTDKNSHWYVKQSAPGHFATWTRGFVAIKDREAHCFNELTRDSWWKAFGC